MPFMAAKNSNLADQLREYLEKHGGLEKASMETGRPVAPRGAYSRWLKSKQINLSYAAFSNIISGRTSPGKKALLALANGIDGTFREGFLRTFGWEVEIARRSGGDDIFRQICIEQEEIRVSGWHQWPLLGKRAARIEREGFPIPWAFGFFDVIVRRFLAYAGIAGLKLGRISQMKQSDLDAFFDPRKAIKLNNEGGEPHLVVNMLETVNRLATFSFLPSPFTVSINAVGIQRNATDSGRYRRAIQGLLEERSLGSQLNPRPDRRGKLKASVLSEYLSDIAPVAYLPEVGGLYLQHGLGVSTDRIEAIDSYSVPRIAEFMQQVGRKHSGKMPVLFADEFTCISVFAELRSSRVPAQLLFPPRLRDGLEAELLGCSYESYRGADFEEFPRFNVGIASRRDDSRWNSFLREAFERYLISDRPAVSRLTEGLPKQVQAWLSECLLGLLPPQRHGNSVVQEELLRWAKHLLGNPDQLTVPEIWRVTYPRQFDGESPPRAS